MEEPLGRAVQRGFAWVQADEGWAVAEQGCLARVSTLLGVAVVRLGLGIHLLR